MIPVYCTTNLDDYVNEDWPRAMVGMPREGEKVRSKHGKTLTIVAITHQLDALQQPILWIELHRRNG